MKKPIAFLLALCLTFGTSGMAFAEEMSPGTPETAVMETQQEETPADTGTENTGITRDSGTPKTSTEPSKNTSVVEEMTEQFHFTSIDLGDLFSQSTARPRDAVGDYFGNKLLGNAKVIYTALLSHFKDIDSTGSGLSMVKIERGLTLATIDDCEAAVDALLKDHTELIYWVSRGDNSPFTSGVNESGTVALCFFPVIPDYKTGAEQESNGYKYYNINAEKGESGQTKADAMIIADEIVSSANGSDYENVKAFNAKICALTSYDEAAAKPDAEYGDSSQMTNVFLGKPVVCEGYAKAFKYLCDKADIGCFIVEGQLDSEPHMWNYVQLGGKWYIVDVTSNDGPKPTERLLAIGSANKAYENYALLDGILNPDVKVETTDYAPGQPPVEPEKIKLSVTLADAESLFIFISKADITTPKNYDGNYRLNKEDIILTDKTGKTYSPTSESEDNNHNGYCFFSFDPRLPAGGYTVTVNPKEGFTVAIEGDHVTAKAALPDTVTTFTKPDEHGVVTVTITVPGVNDPTIDYRINGNSWEYGTTTGSVTFPISATDPDDYPTKEITSVAAHTAYDRCKEVTASYTFEPADDAFQVNVTPVTGLYGFITNKTLMATLSAENAKGDVTYEIDESQYFGHNDGFVVDGNKVYSKEGRQFDPMDHTLYVKATDSGDSTTVAGTVAFGSAVIHIAEEAPSKPDDDDSDDGSSGGGGSSGSSTTTTGSSSGTTTSLSAEIATKEAEKTVAAAIAQAIATNAKTATASVVIRNTDVVSASTLKAIIDAVQKVSVGKGVVVTPTLISDVVRGNAILSRLYIDPTKVTLNTDIKLGVALENKPVTDLFAKYYSNEMSVVSFAQQGSFGMPVNVAVKLDLSKLNAKTLKFYSYDAKTNVCTTVAVPNAAIDVNGYLHFTTTIGNNVVITDKPLTLK